MKTPPGADSLAQALAAARAREEEWAVHPLRGHTASRERFQRSCTRALEVLSAESLDKLSSHLEAALEDSQGPRGQPAGAGRKGPTP